MKHFLLILSTVLLGHSIAIAATQEITATASDLSNRDANKTGVYLSLLGDPAPTIIGVNASYNLKDWMRLTLGYGEIEASATSGSSESKLSLTNLGGGAKFMVPGWSFSPVAGLNYSHVFKGGNVETDIANDYIYGTLGADWQARNGFNFAFGVNTAFATKSFSIPYLNFGWFF